jgi:hypothetical protein
MKPLIFLDKINPNSALTQRSLNSQFIKSFNRTLLLETKRDFNSQVEGGRLTGLIQSPEMA